MIVGLGSIIAVLVIMLIFFVLRGQNMQRELALTRQTAKTNAKKVNYAYTSLVVVTNNLQQIFVSRVEKAHQRALISEDQYGVLAILANQYSRVVMDCCEKEATVEEALIKSLKKTPLTIEEVKDIVKEFPSEVRMAWSKNTPDGFTAAMNHISQYINGKQKKSSTDQEAEAKAS
ncbi:hypothetical protein [Alteromonas sp. H39]|uniref:hypothetical protein n=1 Tax=Alteromonas sp. H39 TaxID=3389876 RepID=UPI0039E14BB8